MIDETKLIAEFENIIKTQTTAEGDDIEAVTFHFCDIKNIIRRQPQADNWIPINEQKPQETEWVLVKAISLPEKERLTPFIAYLKDGEWYIQYWCRALEDGVCEITHWQPLPE